MLSPLPSLTEPARRVLTLPVHAAAVATITVADTARKLLPCASEGEQPLPDVPRRHTPRPRPPLPTVEAESEAERARRQARDYLKRREEQLRQQRIAD